jgi:hypothetical protein
MKTSQTLLQIWKNKGQIIEGIKNTVFKKEHIEEVFQSRMAECEECPELDIKGSKCAAAGTQPCCGSCGCSLRFKLRSMSSSCPRGNWDAILTQDEEDLLTNKLNEQ